MKKAFTLIELLAVVIVIGIIGLITVPTVDSIIKNSKEKAYNAQVDMILEASRKWAIDNSEELPAENSSDMTQIDINSLIKGGYITKTEDGKLYNPKDKNKTMDGCVEVNYSSEYNQYIYNYNESCVIKLPDYADASGANKPELTDKLIPVIYDGVAWKVADKTQKWYDYNNKEWANAVILNNGVAKTVGQSLDLNDDVAMMYVWIPRYEYKIPEESKGTTGTPKSIKINFIDSSKTTATTGYSIHPGFTFNNKNQNGIWIGKFETTTTDATCLGTVNYDNCNKVQQIKVLPNTDSLRYITPSNMFNSSRKAQTDYNLTGLDIHMSKYTEWTAVSYLTNSKYGRCTGDTCTEVTINNYYGNSKILTGCAGASVSASSSTICAYTYEKKEGQLASTTGNITGVYDMSGGTWEYVMGFARTATGKTMSDYSEFSTTTSNSQYDKLPTNKYYDQFSLSGLDNGYYSDVISYNGTTNYVGILSELQNNKAASSSWFGDYAYSAFSYGSWFCLGGGFDNKIIAGIFASNGNDGRADNHKGFRVVLSIEKL